MRLFFSGAPVALPPAVHWPIQPAEIQRRFAPKFCPRRDGSHHALEHGRSFAHQRDGSYRRKDGRRVPRYLGLACGSSFSKQAFAVTYYLKRPELLLPIAATALHELGSVEEGLVADHFETFVRTQDYPLGVATLVGRDSWFVYALDPAPHRRTGSRSAFQEARRLARPPQSTRGGYTGSMARLLDGLLHFFPEDEPFRLVTNGHEAYRRVLEQRRFRSRFRHAAYPNPKRGPKGRREAPTP